MIKKGMYYIGDPLLVVHSEVNFLNCVAQSDISNSFMLNKRLCWYFGVPLGIRLLADDFGRCYKVSSGLLSVIPMAAIKATCEDLFLFEFTEDFEVNRSKDSIAIGEIAIKLIDIYDIFFRKNANFREKEAGAGGTKHLF